MTTNASTRQSAGPGISAGKIGAVITSIISWITTYWCVLWIMQPAADTSRAVPIAVSVVAEVVLVLMKRCLFNADRSDDGIGWAGIVIDAIVNAGGILPSAGRLLTFPPIAAILTAVGIDAANKDVNTIGAFLVAVVAGALLSVLPHRLWKSGE